MKYEVRIAITEELDVQVDAPDEKTARELAEQWGENWTQTKEGEKVPTVPGVSDWEHVGWTDVAATDCEPVEQEAERVNP